MDRLCGDHHRTPACRGLRSCRCRWHADDERDGPYGPDLHQRRLHLQPGHAGDDRGAVHRHRRLDVDREHDLHGARQELHEDHPQPARVLHEARRSAQEGVQAVRGPRQEGLDQAWWQVPERLARQRDRHVEVAQRRPALQLAFQRQDRDRDDQALWQQAGHHLAQAEDDPRQALPEGDGVRLQDRLRQVRAHHRVEGLDQDGRHPHGHHVHLPAGWGAGHEGRRVRLQDVHPADLHLPARHLHRQRWQVLPAPSAAGAVQGHQGHQLRRSAALHLPASAAAGGEDDQDHDDDDAQRHPHREVVWAVLHRRERVCRGWFRHRRSWDRRGLEVRQHDADRFGHVLKPLGREHDPLRRSLRPERPAPARDHDGHGLRLARHRVRHPFVDVRDLVPRSSVGQQVHP